MVERLTRQVDELLVRLGEVPSTAARKKAPETETSIPTTPAKRGPKQRHAHGRGTLPAKLPRDTVVVPRPEICPHCGNSSLRTLETVESEAYDYVRAHVRIRKTVRTVCRCNDCLGYITPPLPPMPFEHASCTFEMLAWVLYGKGALHLPLERVRAEPGSGHSIRYDHPLVRPGG
jgi:transposase